MNKSNNKKLLTTATPMNILLFFTALFMYLGIIIFKDIFANYLILDVPRSFFTFALPVFFATGISMFLAYHAINFFEWSYNALKSKSECKGALS